MKKLVLLTLLAFPAAAQFHMDLGGLVYVQTGTSITFDGLTFQPADNLQMTDLTITRSSTPQARPDDPSIARVYSISNSLIFSGLLGLKYLDSDLNGIEKEDLWLATRAPTALNFLSATVSSSIPETNTIVAYYESTKDLHGQITAFRFHTPLPVVWQSFTVQSEGPLVQLRWSTTTELNTSDFAVERSNDGRVFSKLAVLPAVGSASSPSTYQYTDSPEVPGTYYYRIRSTDLDGSVAYTGIRSATIGKRMSTMAILPNPTNGPVTVGGLNERNTVKVYDPVGRLIHNLRSDKNEALLDLSGYPGGLYMVVVEENGARIETRRLIKQ